MLSVIIAAGALFTAVYDVLYKYNTTNTTILNAATVDGRGLTYWEVKGSAKNCNETTTVNFDEGTYLVMLEGQASNIGGYTAYGQYGQGADCIAFYKGNSMTVTIGVPGGKGGAEDGSEDGGGATYVQSNFALPTGTSAGTAIASGAGGGSRFGDFTLLSDALKLMDGTFAGWPGNNVGVVVGRVIDGSFDGDPAVGTPATQEHGGYYYPNIISANTNSACGGGAGYFDGGAGHYGHANGGGGSCSPNCYPISSSDIQNGPVFTSGEHAGYHFRGNALNGAVYWWRLDPDGMPTSDHAVVYGNTVKISGSGSRYTPKSALNGIDPALASYDCGIKVGWVYSCSEDGEKWGASSDNLRSTAE